MIRQAVAAIFTAAALLAAVTPAQAAGGHYRADAAAAPAAQRLIVRDIIWRCDGAACTAAANGSRPAIVCASLAREVGTLRSFSAGGRAFDANALEACNRRAR